MSRVIDIDHVSAGYRGVPVLADVTFGLEEGEMAALLGPNGAGKSTLLRVITGLHACESGGVRLAGREVRSLGAVERSRLVAVVPQALQTPMAFRVEELVMMGRTARLRPWEQPADEDRRAVAEAMASTDVLGLRGRPLDALSGGERQRAVIAMALAQEPRIILMDEPTAHLDISHALDVLRLVVRLNRERHVTVLLASHDLTLAAAFCPRLLLLDGGRLAADGPPAEVLREERLEAVYRCALRVRPDPESGAMLVLPALERPEAGSMRRAAEGGSIE